MKNGKFWIWAGIIVLAAVLLWVFVPAIVSIIWGIFWTFFFSFAVAGMVCYVMEYIRWENKKKPAFHVGWTVVVVILVFLQVWDFGYNNVMFGKDITAIEQKFVMHAKNDKRYVEDKKLNYGGKIDQVIAERNKLLNKRHMKMMFDSRWRINTESGIIISKWYTYDFFWWWPKPSP